MTLFLLIIYWNSKNRKDVVLGQDSEYDSDGKLEDDELLRDATELNFDLQRRTYLKERHMINTDRIIS